MKIEVRGDGKLTPYTKKLVHTAIKRLKKNCKLDKDLVIEFKELKYHGWSWSSKGKYWIQIRPKECHSCVVDTLTHEWAHFMTKSKLVHTDDWGIAYAKCYRVVSR